MKTLVNLTQNEVLVAVGEYLRRRELIAIKPNHHWVISGRFPLENILEVSIEPDEIIVPNEVVSIEEKKERKEEERKEITENKMLTENVDFSWKDNNG